MSYANDYNSYMLDDYGLPSYSSRRSSYNYAFNDQIPQPSNAYPGNRKLSTASERSTATKSLELPPPRFDFSRQNSTVSLVSEPGIGAGQGCRWCDKKVRNIAASIVLLLGGVLFVLGICLVVFSNDDHHKSEAALAPLGYFFLTLGILVTLLTLSVLFLPSPVKPSGPRFVNALNLLNPSQLPRTISSLEMDQQTSVDEASPATPKITITPESSMSKYPMGKAAMNAIEDGPKYGESSKSTNF